METDAGVRLGVRGAHELLCPLHPLGVGRDIPKLQQLGKSERTRLVMFDDVNILGPGLRKVAPCLVSFAEIQACAPVVRVQLNSSQEALNGFIASIRLVEGISQQTVARAVVGADGGEPLQDGSGLPGAVELQEQRAEV